MRSLIRYCYRPKIEPIAHVRYIKILSWLRGFLVIFPIYLVWFTLCSSLFWELRDNGVLKNLQFLTLKPRSHVRILMYRTWAIESSLNFNGAELRKMLKREDKLEKTVKALSWAGTWALKVKENTVLLNEQEQYMRRDCVEIKGISVTHGEDTSRPLWFKWPTYIATWRRRRSWYYPH